MYIDALLLPYWSQSYNEQFSDGGAPSAKTSFGVWLKTHALVADNSPPEVNDQVIDIGDYLPTNIKS